MCAQLPQLPLRLVFLRCLSFNGFNKGPDRDWAGPSNSMQRGRVIMADQGHSYT